MKNNIDFFVKNFFSSSNWYFYFKNRITSINKLERFLDLTLEEKRGLIHTKFPFAITEYLLGLMDNNSPNCPIRKQFIPIIDEIRTTPEELSFCSMNKDNLQNDNSKEIKPFGLIHKYSDRAILFLTDLCASYCRFCSKKHYVGKNNWIMTNGEFGFIKKYLEDHSEIKQVILSGGDPLILSDEKINFFLSHLRKIPHISIIRIETRVPIVLPHRVTHKLCEIFKKYKPIYMCILFNHPKEINEWTKYVCEMLADNGVVLLSNTVLLKGINDKVQILSELFYELLKIRVRPYSLFQCDIVEGNSHFRVSFSTVMKILKQLKSLVSGLAVPDFIINVPNHGKIYISPQCFISKTKDSVILKDLEEKIVVYPETK
ncbi:MAG: KamA family radical SAM protein [Endomicrobiia bacterium]